MDLRFRPQGNQGDCRAASCCKGLSRCLIFGHFVPVFFLILHNNQAGGRFVFLLGLAPKLFIMRKMEVLALFGEWHSQTGMSNAKRR